MELGYAVVIPTFVFLDANLTPLERLLYGVLSGTVDAKACTSTTNEALAKTLQVRTEDGVIKRVSEESVEKMLTHLEERNYITINEQSGNRIITVNFQKSQVSVTVKTKKVPRKDENNMEVAEKVLKYLSDCLLIRGYRKIAMKPSKANLEHIIARLSEGHTFDEMVSIINVKFEDPYFKENTQYLVSQTLFRPSNFEKYLNQSAKIANIEKRVVTKTGLSNVVRQKEVEEEVATF